MEEHLSLLKSKIYIRITVSFIFFFMLISCIERGKPIEKENVSKKEDVSKQKKVAHYICPNGHKGAENQGKCSECNTTLQHNQAYHGLNIPKNGIKDPFSGTSNSNATSTPIQNKYGDYHYTCPNGHAGGSGTADNCKICDTKLEHNQLYHK